MRFDFVLDQRLAAETVPVTHWPLCVVLLQDDARYPWLILVPQRAGLSEIHDLAGADRMQLALEQDLASRALKQESGAEKMNVAALGNVVPQLHVHVIARRQGDEAWPGPVWGRGARVPYAPGARDRLMMRLRGALEGALR